VILQMSRDLS